MEICYTLKEEADKEKEEVKEMEEGGDLLNLVLQWKQKQVLEAEARSSKQVSSINLKANKVNTLRGSPQSLSYF